MKRQVISYTGFISSLLLFFFLCTGCTTGKNNASTRAFHELTTRYNIYYNAEQAYHQILEEQSRTFTDHYDTLLPLYPQAIPHGKRLRGGPFDEVVEKTSKAIREHSITAKPRRDPAKRESAAYREWLRQEEFNPFLHNVWMLLGKAHLQNGDQEEALAVFSHVCRLYRQDQDIVNEAVIWMLRCYTEMNRMYEAEKSVRMLQAGEMPARLENLFTETYTHYLLRRGDYEKAIPQVKKVIAGEKNIRQKKRLQYLLGQLLAVTGDREGAYRAFESVKGLRTSFECTLHATASQLALADETQQPKIRKTLMRMKRKAEENDLLCIDQALRGEGVAEIAVTRAIGNEQGHRGMPQDSVSPAAVAHDSLYQKAYRAFCEGDTTTVWSASALFAERYPASGWMPQLMMMEALSRAYAGDPVKTEALLQNLTQRYPESEVAPLAATMREALLQGSMPPQVAMPFSHWESLSDRATSTEDHTTPPFLDHREGPHLFLLVFNRVTADRNKLLFSTAGFNFTRFRLRTFNLSFIPLAEREALSVASFRSYDEAFQYGQMLLSDSIFAETLPGNTIPVVISEENANRLVTSSSLDDYLLFHALHLEKSSLPSLPVTTEPQHETIGGRMESREKIVPLDPRSSRGKAPGEETHKGIPSARETEQLTPDALLRQLEQNAQKVLQQTQEPSSGKIREKQLKERERMREERIRQREKELKERARRREALLKQRERERAQKIRKR